MRVMWSLAEKAHVSIEGANIIDPMLVLRDEPTEWGDEMVNGLYEVRRQQSTPSAARHSQTNSHTLSSPLAGTKEEGNDSRKGEGSVTIGCRLLWHNDDDARDGRWNGLRRSAFYSKHDASRITAHQDGARLQDRIVRFLHAVTR